jgi:hypothetical protein
LIRILALVALVACGSAAPPPTPTAPAADVVPAPVVASPLDARLAALSVTDDDFYRSTLYTWTTPAAIAAVRSTHTLLIATTTSGGFVSPFNRAIAVLAVTARPGADVARVLRDDPQLSRRRYAWPAPFATVLGVGPRAYGNALIRIDLRGDAWIGRFAPAERDPFTFVDATGHRIANADVVAAPERIAAIFHVRTEAAVPYREYVVCNPAMIDTWSIATPEIRAELDAERSLVSELGAIALPHAEAPAVTAWSTKARTTLARWHATLAFDNERYRPLPAALAHLAKTLANYDPAGAALSVP